MAVSVARFLESLATTGIVSGEVLAQIQAACPTKTHTKDADELARSLIQQGKLTRYQAAAIYNDKAKTLVLGNYLLLDKLGAGGMGQVFRARHRRMDRIVALKILPKKALASPDAVARFQREAKAAAKLSHANIVTAYDADEADGTHFLVMEYVEGSDLSSLVEKTGPLPPAKALKFIADAARGLQHAHAEGVVHRDIKPGNLLVDKRGNVKILDMGLARIDEPATVDDATAATRDDDLTQAGTVNGTVNYMAPEQALDLHSATERADIYSLGCTLFFLLTGRPPYVGDSVVKRLLAHRDAPIPSIRTLRSEVPEAVDKLFQRMAAKRPEDRPKNMTELLAILEAKSPAASLPAVTTSSSDAKRRTTSAAPNGKSRKLLLTGGGLAAVTALAAGYVLLASRGTDSKAPQVAQGVSGQAAVAPVARPSSTATASTAVTRTSDAPSSAALSSTSANEKPMPAEPATFLSPPPVVVSAAPQATSTTLEKTTIPPATPLAAAAQLAAAAPASPTPRTPMFDPAAERTVAEWALGLGAKIEIVTDTTPPTIATEINQLPAGPFAINGFNAPEDPQFKDDSVKRLIGLCRLTRLVVTRTGVTEGVIEHILEIPTVVVLGIAELPITDVGFERLAALPRLEIINANSTLMTDRGLQSLTRNKGLRHVHINRTQITDSGLAYLNQLPSLQVLSIGGNQITDVGIKTLEANSGLTNLMADGTKVTDAGIELLSRRTNLQQLMLRDTGITDRSVEKLATMTSLTELTLNGTQISQAGFDRLKSALPNCRIDWSPPSAAALMASVKPEVKQLTPLDTASRAPVPSADERDKSMKTLKEVYRDDYAAAKKPEDKAVFADKLFKQAQETRGDVASAYVMLAEARSLAVDAADAALLVRIVHETANRYEVDPWEELADALESTTQKVHPLSDFKTAAETALSHIDEALEADRFDVAKRLSDVALAAARKSKDSAVLKEAVDRGKDLTAMKPQWDSAQAARATLASMPNDPEANLVLGRYLCFTKADWSAGLAKLALGSDSVLKELATRSLTDPQDALGQADLGEAWAKAADDAKGKAKAELQAGARYWYAKALPALSGLAKAKAEQRLKQLGSEDSPAGRTASTSTTTRPTRRPANSLAEQLARDRKAAEWVLARRGKVGILYPGLTAPKQVERVADLPPHPFGLVKIDLFQDKELTNDDLSNLEGLANLVDLRLEATPISNEGLPHIVGLANLTTLSLESTRVGDAGMEHLRGLKNLNTLRFGNCVALTDDGIETLKGLPNLTYLNLTNTRVTSTRWIAWKAFPHLQTLILSRTPITDEAVDQLRVFPRLRELDLSFTAIGDAALAKLAAMPQLGSLTLQSVKVSDADVLRLRAALPQCRIQF